MRHTDRHINMLSAEERAEVLRVAEKVQQTALHHLSSNRSRSFAITFISNLQRGVDHIVQAAIDQGLEFDCRAGCSYCCNVRVEALAPEIFQISMELKKHSLEYVEELIERLRKHSAATKGVSVLNHRIPCPFLKENLCSIYHVRPTVCRKAHSFDVEKCERPGSEIPESFDVLLKSEALMKGTSDAYRQRKLSASGYELGQAVLLALTDETAELRWFRGEDVFNEVRGW